jgi:hypothetical protein
MAGAGQMSVRGRRTRAAVQTRIEALPAAPSPSAQAQIRREGRAREAVITADPVLSQLKRLNQMGLLPGRDDIKRATEKAQKDFFAWMNGKNETGKPLMAAASSDPATHAYLQKRPAQQRVTKATAKRSHGSEALRAAIREEWTALEVAGVPERTRAGKIAKNKKILAIAEKATMTARHVRRLLESP